MSLAQWFLMSLPILDPFSYCKLQKIQALQFPNCFSDRSAFLLIQI